MSLSYDRRSGKDRRQTDVSLPDGKERRRNIDSRRPEIAEITITDDEWTRYFGHLSMNVAVDRIKI